MPAAYAVLEASEGRRQFSLWRRSSAGQYDFSQNCETNGGQRKSNPGQSENSHGDNPVGSMVKPGYSVIQTAQLHYTKPVTQLAPACTKHHPLEPESNTAREWKLTH